MRLPIDTQTVHFVAAGPAEAVIDFETKTQRVDATGQPLFNVHLFALGGGSRDSITVKVGGEPKGLGDFTPVKVTALMASTWEVGDKHGVSFRAERIEINRAAAA
jgi:hypothetical protein